MRKRHAHSRVFIVGRIPAGGFTLVEVLTAVAIVALLVAILLPSLAKARQQAQRIACAANLRAMGQALNLYRSGLGRYPTTGDRDPTVFGPFWRHGDPKPPRRAEKLAEIADLAEALVSDSLGDPRTMYCPSSYRDRYAPQPYAPGVATWRTGKISYIYLVGLDPQLPESLFPDDEGQPTYDPILEAPERGKRINPRAVLLGDRTVELVPPNWRIPGSNHGREGGWFLFTSGQAQWFDWGRLAAHPTKVYVWYWPRVCSPGAGHPLITGKVH